MSINRKNIVIISAILLGIIVLLAVVCPLVYVGWAFFVMSSGGR